MSFFNTMNTSASGLTAQSVRMDTIAQNIANADTTRTATGDPYRRSMVIFEERTADFQTTFMSMLRPAAIREEISNNITNSIAPTSNAAVANNRNTQGISSSAGQMFLSSNGVRVRNIISDQTPGPRTFEPSHPDADEEGYVTRPNVNIVTEMVNMISASRSYEANLTSINVTRAMINRTMEISGR